MVRAGGSYPLGCRFESCRAYHSKPMSSCENRRFARFPAGPTDECATQCATAEVTTWHHLAQRGTTGTAGRGAQGAVDLRLRLAGAWPASRPVAGHGGVQGAGGTQVGSACPSAAVPALWPRVGPGVGRAARVPVAGPTPHAADRSRPRDQRQAVAEDLAPPPGSQDTNILGTGNFPGSSRNRSSSPSSP